ncbi:4'-phosphopantetheinyl transferase superfamily [Phakopsora pachyrhizi]|uniref:4'-phosphopantetheinyl transferase superfamily n=1 Tax=Phakopsora pachyrhizi TaxID=170000 RepID=A0AAV0AZR0_PHAPC|nr:4'-phosphopantetheinyl transferase superfamily [Phakopsora pachyrhizi]CAH7676164.1 4'-phosphopantetheinyl transferase superfamily [Phakopsora pachyrhizi]
MKSINAQRIIGIGTDIVKTDRIKALISRSNQSFKLRFISKVLSQFERSSEEFKLKETDDDQLTQFLANRWAVKEAAYKAIYPTYKPTWKQLSFLKLKGIILSDNNNTIDNPKPILLFHPEDDIENSILKLHASISHDGNNTLAFVVACS